MSIAKQLYQLQEADLELESSERARQQIIHQLGESEAVVSARQKLEQEHQHLAELKHEQHSIEWEIDGITSKLTTTQDELYSGRIHNPKELTNLQHEIDGLKGKRDQLEEKILEIMEQVELVTTSIATIDRELKILEDEWQRQQQQLATQAEQLQKVISTLKDKRQLLANEIDHETITIYQGLRKQKRTAVAKVAQGICGGCRISLSVTELQRARSGRLVPCSSCGRILFFA